MLHNLDELRGYDIAATDGSIGKATDFYFDDHTWHIRYMVVTTGWLFGRDVLVAPDAIGRISRDRSEISVSMTRKQVEEGPGIGTDLPVSRQDEMRLRSHHGWAPYWDLYPAGMGPLIPPMVPDRRAAETPASSGAVADMVRETSDPHLRSAKEVEGYHIAARDGEIGHVEDFVVEEDSWLIRYLVVDTRNWLPGRKVLVAPHWATGIDWVERLVAVDLTREAIRSGPEYEPHKPIDRPYEAGLHRHFDQVGYWE